MPSLNLPPALLAATRGGLVLLGPDLADGRPVRGAGMNPAARGANDELVNLALIGLVAAFALALLLRAAGNGRRVRDRCDHARRRASRAACESSPTQATRRERSAPPGCPPVALLGVVAALLIGVARGARLVRLATGRRGSGTGPLDDPHRIQGTATAATSTRSHRRRHSYAAARPSVPRSSTRRPSDVGYLLGRSCGREIWASVEDSILVIGPPRSGKGLHLVINAILDAPGAVVTTSTRPDNIAATIDARKERGPVAVFDPQRLTAGLRASAARRALVARSAAVSDPLTAMIRATGLASSTGLSSGGVGVRRLLGGQGPLRAPGAAPRRRTRAAPDSSPLRVVAVRRQPQPTPSASSPATRTPPTGWADSLEGDDQLRPAHPRLHLDGRRPSPLLPRRPRVLDAVSPEPGEEFDPRDFLTSNGTLYLLATGAGAGASWPLVAAFIEDLTETARHLAAASPGARLDPPLLLALDEIGNLAPLPSLPVLMAEGGGTGITTMPVLQSLSQARDKWGDHAASTIWDASIVKVILGGASASKDLQELSVLIGERDERTDTVTIGDYGSRSLQRSTRRVPVMPPERIRTLPFGTGLVLLRSAPPIVTDLRRWTDR